MEFDAVEGKNDVEAEDCKILAQGYTYIAVFNHCRCCLHCRNPLCNYQQNYQNSEFGGKEKRDPRVLVKARPNKAGPVIDEGFHLTPMETP